MKKFLSLLLFIMVAFSASAQVVITCNGTEVKEGDCLTFYAYKDDFDGISCGDHYEPYINPTEDASVKKITVTMEVSAAAAASQMFSWCGIDNNCVPVGSQSTTKSSEMSILGTSMQLHVYPVEGKYFDETVKVTVQCGMQTVIFYERYVYSEETLGKDMEHTTGIDQTLADKGSVVFNGNALTYNFTGNAARKLQLFGIDGKLLKNVTVNGTDGSLNLSGMPKGVYVFSVKEGGKQLQSGKIVLK